MKNRLPIAVSATALVVALLGSTGVANAVTVAFAQNAAKLAGFKASKTSKRNTVVVRGRNGKIDARSIPAQARGARGATGPAGPVGPQGAQGAQGAQGIQGPAGAPNPNAVDSDKVDGFDANGLVRVARVNAGGGALNPAEAVYATVTLNAPSAGFVLVQADYNMTGSGCPCEGWMLLRDAVSGQLASNYKIVEKAVDGGFTSGSMGWVFPVAAGNRSFQLRGFRGQGTAAGVDGPAMQALFVPFGSTGAGTLGQSGVSAPSVTAAG